MFKSRFFFIISNILCILMDKPESFIFFSRCVAHSYDLAVMGRPALCSDDMDSVATDSSYQNCACALRNVPIRPISTALSIALASLERGRTRW